MEKKLSVKEMLKNIKNKISSSKMVEKVKNMKITTTIKDYFKRIKENGFVKKSTDSIRTKFTSTKEHAKKFMDSHNNIKDAAAGNVMHRFQLKFAKISKKLFNKTTKNAESGQKNHKILKFILKTMCMLATVAFIALVIYFIKDVFIYCLMLVAMCAAVMVCIESILWVLSVAFGCRI